MSLAGRGVFFVVGRWLWPVGLKKGRFRAERSEIRIAVKTTDRRSIKENSNDAIDIQPHVSEDFFHDGKYLSEIPTAHSIKPI